MKKNPRQKVKRRTIIAGIGIFILILIVFVGVWQIDKVKEFLSKATGQSANFIIDTQRIQGSMPRPWRNLAQGGESENWRLQPLSNQIKALNTEYVRIDHIYDFYDIVQGNPGNLSFDFSQFDVILNDIKAAGATPYIALSYMPPAISAGDIVEKPHNWTDWQLVVQKTIEHVSGTRGFTNVYYEVWNEPDLFGGWKYYGSKNYLTMYSYAAIGANQARGVRNFYLGGPGITALYRNWFHALAKHALNNNLKLDFISWHRYSHNIEQYEKDLLEARAWLARYPELNNVELHITEWGPDSENHPAYDNNYGAAHTVAGAITMTGAADKIFSFEIQDGKNANGEKYWGRWGLFTHNDTGASAKPRYYALSLLDRIGTQWLPLTGQGSWVKGLAARKSTNVLNVVLVNCDPYGSHAENVPLTFQNVTPGTYQFNLQYLGGVQQQQQLVSNRNVLQTSVPMQANTVMYGELRRIN